MQKFGFYIGVFLAIMVVPFFSKFSQANGKEPIAKKMVLPKKKDKPQPIPASEQPETALINW